MPAIRTNLLIGLALGAGMLSGCTASRLDAGLQPTSNYSYAVDSNIVLPETVSVLPTSFAGPSPSDASYEVASLQPSDMGESEAAVEADVEIVYASPDTPRGEVDRLIAKYAEVYDVPEALVRRVVKRESNFNPRARNRSYLGLMQIRHDTARGMGYEGDANGLLDAETNLKYAVKYLRGAYLVAQGNDDRAVRFYSRGYYYDAKRLGMLDETGLGRDRRRKRA